MCGIVGFHSNEEKASNLALQNALAALAKRGPDAAGSYQSKKVGLGHTRLSILDTSDHANQPMQDVSKRYTLVFNGEIYNYQALQKTLTDQVFQSSSDTEVLLYLLIKEGIACLPKLNGFFAFAFYDAQEDRLLIARDQMGIKPLHYYHREGQLLFASEMKALLQFPIPKKISQQSLHWYLQLNYLPGDLSMIEGISKLTPGHYLNYQKGQLTKASFLSKNQHVEVPADYSEAQKKLVELLDQSVQRRLISDVPLGSFLSGGTDSSAIASLAARHHQNLNTFSIGYADHPFFDETHFAELVAKKAGTNHTTFKLSNQDLLADLDEIISYIDEPFADSSAIPTYLLAKKTRQQVTVALSGDGADELFGGYYKHMALQRGLAAGLTEHSLQAAGTIAKFFPHSRSGKLANTARRLSKFAEMMSLSTTERYWRLASLTPDPSFLLKSKADAPELEAFKTAYLPKVESLQDYLDADQKIVLPGDMLTKVDLMSMANSLEVRVPFLDMEVVHFSRQLPTHFKIKGSERKRILQDAFKTILPKELHHRSKKGFEIPLLDWMRKELLIELDGALFDAKKLEVQGLFEVEAVMSLRKKLVSADPGDVHGTIWALYVFQKWYDHHIN